MSSQGPPASVIARHPLAHRVVRILGYGVIFLALVVMVVTGGLFVMIPRQPTDSPVMRAAIEMILRREMAAEDITVKNVTIVRPSITAPITVQAEALTITQASTGISLSARDIAIEFAPLRFFTGTPVLHDVQVETVRLQLPNNPPQHSAQKNAQNSDFSLTEILSRGIDPTKIIKSLRSVRINDVQIAAYDSATGAEKMLMSVGIHMRRDARFQQSLVTAFARNGSGTQNPVIDFVMTTTDKQDNLEFIAYLNSLDSAQFLRWVPALSDDITSMAGLFSGEIRVQYSKEKRDFSDFSIALNSPIGSLVLPKAQAPLLYQNIIIRMNPKSLTIGTRLQNSDVALTATPIAAASGAYSVTITAPAIRIDDVAQVIGTGHDSAAQEWLTEKLKNGSFEDMKATMDLYFANSGADFRNFMLSGRVKEMDVLYKHELLPASDLAATLSYADDTLLLDIQSGRIGAITVLEGALKFTDLTKSGAGDAAGQLRLRGNLQDVLAYLDNPLIRYKERVSVDLSKASGEVQMTVGLAFPTTATAKMADVKVDVDAVMRQSNLPDLIKGVSLSGGPLALKASPEDVLIRGDARLNGTPAYVTFHSYFDHEKAPYRQSLEIKGSLDAQTLSGFGLSDFVHGVKAASRYALSYKQPLTGAPELTLAVTGADVSVAKASIALSGDNAFQSAALSDLKLGRTRGDVTVKRLKSNGYDVAFNGAVFDASGLLKANESKEETSTPPRINARINADRLLISDQGYISAARVVYANNARGDAARLDLRGRRGDDLIRIDFQEAQNGDRLDADIINAGALLESTGFLEGIKGGHLMIRAQPNGQYGSMKGTVDMRNFTARDAPVIGRLINALSLPGLLQLLTTQGISFERLQSRFTWQKSTNGQSVLRLSDGKTSGSSLGLTFEGTYRQRDQYLDLAGRVVPLSEINNIVKSIPLLGPLVSGGRDGALVAAQYTMRGPARDPKVFINPLSILTPGLLRSILFENERSDSGENADKPAPKKATMNR